MKTTSKDSPFWLGYECESWNNTYYTARVAEHIGVCCFTHKGRWLVQFFPWASALDGNGHARYARFISKGAREIGKDVFIKWPFVVSETDNVMMLKCVIEDGVKQIGALNEDDKRGEADGAAGEAVE